MGPEHIYWRIVTAALGALLGVCVFLAGAKFIRNRAMVLSLLVRAQGALFAVLMGTMAAVGVFRGFAKLPQNYGIVELWNYGNEALGIDGEAQFHNASMSQLHNQVGVNGDFNATNVHWHVVSGAADLSPADGFTTTVTPTGTNEDVVVEARFNGDEIQPRFVMPVVIPRTIPVRFFVVEPPVGDGLGEWKDADMSGMLDKANEIYAQVGIRFELLGTPAYVGTTNDWNIVLGTNYVNRFGMKRWKYSSECRTLLDNYTAADCVEVYFIGSILYPKYYVAATPPYGVVVSKQASITTLAHELGHALGLEDCYVRFNRRDGMVASIIRADEPVDGGFFMFGACDWGMERGRGFYGKDDSKLVTMRRMLMHGTGTNERMDIPAGNVISLSLDARTELEFGTCNPKVGADHIKQENQEVYSR